MGMDASATIGFGLKIPEDIFAEFCESNGECPDMQVIVDDIWLKMNGFTLEHPGKERIKNIRLYDSWYHNEGGKEQVRQYYLARSEVLKQFTSVVSSSFSGSDGNADEFLFVAGTTQSGDWDSPTVLDLKKFQVSKVQIGQFKDVVSILFPTLQVELQWLMICRYF